MSLKKRIKTLVKRSKIGENRFQMSEVDIEMIKALKDEYLQQEGWVLSAKKKLPVDLNGNPLPWFTYPSIHFVKNKLKRNFRVFEYGSGNSTLWIESKVQSIISIEHDEGWFSEMNKEFANKPKITYKYKELDSGFYENEISSFNDEFDIVIIDGRKRVECAKNSLKALKKDGVIIWDNSDRELYNEGYDFLIANGFKRIDFWGMGPINAYAWCTSIFYREANCFNI